MILYNEKLKVLYDMVCRRKHLKSMLAQMEEQESALTDYVQQLEKASRKEQAEVEKLEGGSLKAFLYDILGKKGEKLSKEREEAYNAAVKYESAVGELQTLKADIEKYEEELAGLHGCEKQYEDLLQNKKDTIKNSGHWATEKLFEMENKIAYLENQNRELQEAVNEGEKCLDMVDYALNKLKSAENWGFFDVFGGGAIADFAKYSDIEAAQAQIGSLQTQIRHFKTELADVTVDTKMNLHVDGLLQFADIFIDNIFVDFAVLDKIKQSKAQLEATKQQIQSVLQMLLTMKEEAAAECSQIHKKLEELVVQVNI